MPVIMWGASGEDIARLKDIGFTHFIGLGADVSEIWAQKKAGLPGKPEFIESNRRQLDEALANDMEVIASLSPGRVLESDPKNLRVDRAGKPYPRADICASLPEFAPFFENVGRSMAETYGDHPAFTAALIDSEVRDNSQVSFNPHAVEAYRTFAGVEIPVEVTNKTGVDWTKLANFPANRVIADNDPILRYLRWFWTVATAGMVCIPGCTKASNQRATSGHSSTRRSGNRASVEREATSMCSLIGPTPTPIRNASACAPTSSLP